jgi:hypothetical protein
MNILLRAVVSGFGFSLGAAIYKKVSKRLGLDEEDDKAKDKAAKAAATDRNADGAVDEPADAEIVH